MFLLTFWTLTVYSGSAAVALWLAHRFIQRSTAGAMLLLTLAPLLLTGKALLTAGVYGPIDIPYDGEPFASHRAEMGVGKTQTALLSDVAYQMIPWRKAVREAAKNGHWPLWNRFDLAGTPLLASQLAGVFHPGTWIGFLLPLAQAWTFDMSFRFLLSILCAYLFFRDLGCGEWPAALGACGWGFSDFLVFLGGHPQSAAIGPFPLLLLGLRRLARDADRRATGICIAAVLLVIAGGHPESILYTVSAAGLYFLFELARAGRGQRGRSVLLAIGAGAAALGLAAAALLPFLEVLPHTQELIDRTTGASPRGWIPLHVSARHALTFLMPYAFGVWGQGGVESYIARPDGAYAGALLAPLAVAGMFSRKRERWALLAFVLLGLALFVGLEPFARALSSLPVFSLALLHPFVFLASFGVAALAALGAEEVRHGRGGTRLLVASLGVAAILFVALLRRRPDLLALGMPPGFLRSRAFLQIAPLLAAAAVAAGLARRTPALAVAALLGVFLIARSREANTVHPTYPARVLYPPLRLLDSIPRRQPWRVVGAEFELVPNSSAIYELEDARGYEMTTLGRLVETYPLWCVRQAVWFNRVDHPERPFLSFLNVRYVVASASWLPPAGWTLLAEDSANRLYENPSALPRAFVPRRVFRESRPDRQRRRLFAIRDFGAEGVVEGAPAATFENGAAEARVDSYTSQRIELAIDASERVWVATSIVGWPGWRLTLDGKDQPLFPYNRAFLAFEAPAGKHRAVLRYAPRSFTAGLWISGASVALVLVGAVSRRMKNVTARTTENVGRA